MWEETKEAIATLERKMKVFVEDSDLKIGVEREFELLMKLS